MLFPDINTLFTVNLNGYIRAHRGADAATRALGSFVDGHRPIALNVIFLGGYNVIFGTEMNAQMAFLAEVLVNDYMAFHITFLK
jgi:hypothetical protein